MTSPAAMTELPCNKTILVLLISGTRISQGTDKENKNDDGKRANPPSETTDNIFTNTGKVEEVN